MERDEARKRLFSRFVTFGEAEAAFDEEWLESRPTGGLTDCGGAFSLQDVYQKDAV
jgi:hypothetical protein